MYIREKNKDRYISFNGSFSIASIAFFMLSIIAVLAMIAQQKEERIGVEIYYSFIFLIPFIFFTFLCVLKSILFRTEIKKNSCYVRSCFGRTKQYAYSNLEWKRKGMLLVFYYEGKKHIYFANEVLTSGIDELYMQLKK